MFRNLRLCKALGTDAAAGALDGEMGWRSRLPLASRTQTVWRLR